MAKINNSFTAILDIGASKVVCFIAKITPEGEASIVGVGHQVSQGLKSGVVTDIKLAEKCIRSAVGTAEQIAGIHVDRVIVNVSGNKQKSHNVKAELAIKGNEITSRDIGRIISQAAQQSKTAGREVIHAIPTEYAIDGTGGIKNPQGMYGKTLSADLHVITAESASILNLTNCLAHCHLNAEGYISSAYAAGSGCLTEDEKELGAILLDFGGSSISIGIFKGGNILYTNTVPLGGTNITKDLAIGLSTSIETAERIKNLHGNLVATAKDEQEILDIPQIGEDGASEMNHIPKAELIKIIKPRVEEILEHVQKCLTESGLDKTIGHVVITGGGSQLRGLAELTGRKLKKQARIGMPKPIDGMAESTKGAAFSTCTGMLLLTACQRANKIYNLNNGPVLSNSFIGRFVFWLRENF